MLCKLTKCVETASEAKLCSQNVDYCACIAYISTNVVYVYVNSLNNYKKKQTKKGTQALLSPIDLSERRWTSITV